MRERETRRRHCPTGRALKSNRRAFARSGERDHFEQRVLAARSAGSRQASRRLRPVAKGVVDFWRSGQSADKLRNFPCEFVGAKRFLEALANSDAIDKVIQSVGIDANQLNAARKLASRKLK